MVRLEQGHGCLGSAYGAHELDTAGAAQLKRLQYVRCDGPQRTRALRNSSVVAIARICLKGDPSVPHPDLQSCA